MNRTKLQSWCEGVIEAGWLAALIVSPLYFNVWSSRVFEPDKVSLVRSIALTMIIAWLIKIASGAPGWLPAWPRATSKLRVGSNTGRSSTPAAVDKADEQPPGLWQSVRRVPFFVPVILLIGAYLISTAFSVAPFVSWFGSYQRMQGTYTVLCYVSIAGLTAAHLRAPAQLRRLQHAIILTSVPIALYGVIQHYGLDPLPWGGNTQTRVAANAGNAIFLAAYLNMALFFTLERVYSSFAHLIQGRHDGGDEQTTPAALAGGLYLFVLLVQLAAIFWTQSRGPWLGLLLGLYLFVLLLLVVLRPSNYRRWMVSWVGVGLFGIALIIGMNTLPVFEGLRSVPYVGRLTTLLDQESRTAQVRILIWQGASEMVQPHEALVRPDPDGSADGARDSLNALRPLVGYGPEAMWIAYNPFYPPDLAHWESRNASPDRAHNETWDSLVITGLLGFIAYMSLFVSIFYWSLRWLGLLVKRRDSILFFALLFGCAAALSIVFYITDGSWRLFGVAMPAGLMAGLVFYIMAAAFIQPDRERDWLDTPRQLLIVTVLVTIVAHFVEIHFGIAIASTRTYFWVQTALLTVLGLRLIVPEPFAGSVALPPDEEPEAVDEVKPSRSTAKSRRTSSRKRRTSLSGLPLVPATVASDLLVFLTAVYIFSMNRQGLRSASDVLFASITQREVSGEWVQSPAFLFLLLITWFIAATLGLVTRSLREEHTPGAQWWLLGYLTHAAIVGAGWFTYGLIHADRLIITSDSSVDERLATVSGHFVLFTTVMIGWILLAAVAFAWPTLRARGASIVRRPVLGAVAVLVAALLLWFGVSNVNISLIRADIVYKQGQSFDRQRNYVSSIELYRRALRARETEDHYMLFLGRSILEQAKQAPIDGATVLPERPTLNDVLNLTQDEVQQASQGDLLRAAEVVLTQAQRVNPLNTDHTANLARLYRSWSDLLPADDPMKEEMLDRSLAQYEMVVQLSPNAAHLWNEKGNLHLARGERDLAEESYLYSLSLDQYYEQTYLLLADFYEADAERLAASEASQEEINAAYQRVVDLIEEGIARMEGHRRFAPTVRMYSFLGVALSRMGDLDAAITANESAVAIDPNNTGALQNLAVLNRDAQNFDAAVQWAERTLAATNPEDIARQKRIRRLIIEVEQRRQNRDGIIAQYEAIRQLDPVDVDALRQLRALYTEDENWSGAVNVLQALREVEPANHEHPLQIAEILTRVEQTDDARQFAQEALSLAPEGERDAIMRLLSELGG